MTKTKLFGIVAILALSVGGIAVIPRSQGKDSDKSKIEAVGLAEYGIEVIAPNHSAFTKLLAEKKAGPENPYLVAVVNNSNQGIASCTLKYELLLPDGQTITQYTTQTGGLETVFAGGTAQLTDAIAAKGNLLVSLSDTPSPGQPRNFRTGGGSSNLTRQLADSVKVSVSINGLLFVDGTFVGPDDKNHFELFRGRAEANRELNTEIAQLINDGAKLEAIMKHLEKVANIKSSEVQLLPGETSEHSFGNWMQKTSHARGLLWLGKNKGEQALLERVRSELSIPEIKLRKLKDS